MEDSDTSMDVSRVFFYVYMHVWNVTQSLLHASDCLCEFLYVFKSGQVM